MENIPIKFKSGMNRRADGPASAPYELHNAKLGVHGGVRAYHEPETMEDPAVSQDPNIPNEPGGEKPWIRWNDQWFSRFAENFTGDDGQRVEVLQSHGYHNGNLYLSGTESHRRSGDDENSPHTWRVGKDATEFSQSTLTGPPKIESIDVNYESETSFDAISPRNGVSYLIIPINARGAAGPWVYYSYVPNNTDGEMDKSIGIDIEVNEQCKNVEVYRTREWAQMIREADGSSSEEGPRRGTIGRTSVESDNRTSKGPPPDLSYYFLERASTREDNSATVIDDVPWKHKYESEEEKEKAIPTDTNDRKINAWAYETITYSQSGQSPYSYKIEFGDVLHVGAEALQMIGRDRMMYGNPQWPLKTPQAAMAVRAGGSTGGTELLFAYEYEIDSVGKVYGPDLAVSDMTKLWPIWQGEQAAHVWSADGSTHWDRLTVGSQGVYPRDSRRSQVRQDGRNRSGSDEESDPQDEEDPHLSYSEVYKQKWVKEPNVVLLSERFRPLEITFEDQYEVPEGERIKAFSPARLAEEESIANYSFYIFSDEGVHSGELTEDEAQTYRVSTVGIKAHTVVPVNRPNTPTYTKQLYTLTKIGAAYMGTDNRVYHLNGRQFEALDAPVPNIWYSDLGEPQFANVEYQAIYNNYSDVWSQVGGFDGDKTLTPYDLAYDEQRDQLMVATMDNVWVFDFDQKGWVGNYNVEGVENLQYIGNLDDSNTAEHRAVMAHNNPGDDADYILLNEDGDSITDNAVVTNPILRAPNRTKIQEVILDYDPLAKDGDVSLTDGSDILTIEEGDSFETPLDEMGSVFIPYGKDNGDKNLTGVIEGVSTPTTAVLTEPSGVDAPPESPIPMRWYPPATVRQEPTGDHYSTTDVDGDPVRRSEIAYKAPPRRKRYPRANGTGHIIRIENFRNFKSLQLMVVKSDL